MNATAVVNCFQKLLSSWHDTTSGLHSRYSGLLWIAFKNYYLRDTTQLAVVAFDGELSCELLSKIIIFVTRHNDRYNWMQRIKVVNCFQKLLSSWHDTTVIIVFYDIPMLWIAFKNYYLRDTTQLDVGFKLGGFRCELLSKIIIFVTRHNLPALLPPLLAVVNCFQKLLSSWHDTTQVIKYHYHK